METIEETPAELPPPPPRPSRRLIWVLAILAVMSTGVAAFALSRDRTPEPPPAAPLTLDEIHSADLGTADFAAPFEVPTLDGSTFSLAEHLETTGTPVFLNLWASWCPPCRAEMPEIDAAAVRHSDVRFVGVAVQDDYSAAADFATEIGVQYTIGLDERGVVNAHYPSFGLPVSYLIGPDGAILQAMYGQIDGPAIDAVIAAHLGD